MEMERTFKYIPTKLIPQHRNMIASLNPLPQKLTNTQEREEN